MAKIQKRRTISLARNYYEALKTYSERLGVPLVKIVESAVFAELRDAGLLTDEDKKSSTDGKYWDPERKRWRSPSSRGHLNA